MVRLTRNVPRKLTDSTFYSKPTYCEDETMVKPQPTTPAVSSADFKSALKRIAELEERVNVLSMKPATMPPEKEEMLDAALNRVDVLEHELTATRKVPTPIATCFLWNSFNLLAAQYTFALSFVRCFLLSFDYHCLHRLWRSHLLDKRSSLLILRRRRRRSRWYAVNTINVVQLILKKYSLALKLKEELSQLMILTEFLLCHDAESIQLVNQEMQDTRTMLRF